MVAYDDDGLPDQRGHASAGPSSKLPVKRDRRFLPSRVRAIASAFSPRVRAPTTSHPAARGGVAIEETESPLRRPPEGEEEPSDGLHGGVNGRCGARGLLPFYFGEPLGKIGILWIEGRVPDERRRSRRQTVPPPNMYSRA